MTDKGGRTRSSPRGRAALRQIDLQLDGLLGKLGDTLGEMIERLEDGETGEFRRSHELQTPRGPVRAEAGLRVRMGLGDAAGGRDLERDREDGFEQLADAVEAHLDMARILALLGLQAPAASPPPPASGRSHLGRHRA